MRAHVARDASGFVPTCGERPSEGARRLRFECRCTRLARDRPSPQDRRVSPHRIVGLGALLAAACTPPIEPAWLVTGPRELALDVEVIAQGPFGARIPAGPRTTRDALPRDTLRLRPAVVDADGPLDPAALEAAWFLCAGLGPCLLRGPVAERPACTGEAIQPPEPCRFADGGEARLTIGELPRQPISPTLTVFDLVTGPTVALVASTPDGPGVDACLARFDARARLDGCLLMERTLGIGPLGELAHLLRLLGGDPGIGVGAETLLARPRNRNPAVERFRVEVEGEEAVVVDAGGVVAVPRDAAIVVALETSEEDLDDYEAMHGPATVRVTEGLDAQWWLDREVDLEEPPYGQLWVRLRAGAVTGTVRAYVALRDDRGGEGWGFVDLELEG